MKKKKADTSIEKRILIGLIISSDFVKEIRQMVDLRYFKNAGSRKIAKWCIDYYDSYDDTPKLHIKDIFDTNLRNELLSEDESEFIGSLLSNLSETWKSEHKLFNVPYLSKVAEEFFLSAQLLEVGQSIITYASEGDLLSASHAIVTYKPLQRRSNDASIDPLSDVDLIRQSFEEQFNILFKLPGELGQLMNYQFYRGSLIGILAPEKRGKSFLLQEFAMRALRSRCKVAIFETGDMTVNDRLRRIHSYIAKKPISRFNDGSGSMKKMIRIPRLEDGRVEVFEEEREVLTWRRAAKIADRWIKMFGRGKLKISSHSNSTINVKEISQIIDEWEHLDGFVPDVIIIDYADILKPENERIEFRHQQNESWKALRRLSQDRNCCVITATQADAASYKQASLGLSNFSEDKRKFAHVTAFYALNQTPTERANCCMRIGELLVRETYAGISKEVTILQCLDICRPVIDSFVAVKEPEDETYES